MSILDSIKSNLVPEAKQAYKLRSIQAAYILAPVIARAFSARLSYALASLRNAVDDAAASAVVPTVVNI